MKRFHAHAAGLLKEKVPIILTGDYNVIPTEQDAYKPERWVTDALFQPESREAFQKLLEQGWIDALRKLHPDEPIYTYWDYFRNAFGRNAGIRIDHFLLNSLAERRLLAGGVDREVRGWEKTSDHAPVWIELSDE
jgi:exodeoxyribonuclease-3